jgi:hypothetical protein
MLENIMTYGGLIGYRRQSISKVPEVFAKITIITSNLPRLSFPEDIA